MTGELHSQPHTLNQAAGAASATDSATAIIARILAGEKRLFHELIRPLERPVFLMLFMILRNESDAEDVAQEVFLKIYRNLHSFRGDAKFSTWAFSIARNEGLARLRKRASHPEEPLESAFTDPDSEPHGDFTPALLTDWREVPLEALERKELGDWIRRAILSLPPIYREIVLLRDVDQLDVRETATVLGITAGSVKVRLHRARLMLQKELAPMLERYAPERRGFFAGRAGKWAANWAGRRV